MLDELVHAEAAGEEAPVVLVTLDIDDDDPVDRRRRELHDTSSSRSCSTRVAAARRTNENSSPDRSAMSRSECSPSDWFNTHSSASSLVFASASPPMVRYKPRLPSIGSPYGLRLRYRWLCSSTSMMRKHAS